MRNYAYGMASLESVRQKLQRSKALYDELYRELIAYYQSNPGNLFPTPDSTPEHPRRLFREKSPVPARLGLICGDSLQCLRSSLDYLVWELALASATVPHKQLLFPIALREKDYIRELKDRKRLDGIDANAIALIDALQPYHSANPEDHTLAMLDALTNINKHRRVLLTGLSGSPSEFPDGTPHIIGSVTIVGMDGEIAKETPIFSVLTIQDGFAKNIEITNFLKVTARFIVQEILPQFEQFFL